MKTVCLQNISMNEFSFFLNIEKKKLNDKKREREREKQQIV